MLFFPRVSRVLPFAIGGIIGGSYSMMAIQRQRKLILNDFSRPSAGESIAKYAEPLNGKGLSRFGGKLDYHQLTFGSFAGMVSGYFFGRISKLLVGAIVTTLMGVEYLALSGHIDLRPFYSGVYNWCKNHWHQEILVDDPSFKYSFVAAFLISAYNA